MIGTKSYRLVAETISESQDLGKFALDKLLDMRENIIDANINPFEQHKRRLVNTIDATYGLIGVRHFNLNKPTQNFVRNLQQHVLRTYGNNDIDEFLREQYIQVPQTFAAISNFIGIPVTETGDKFARFQDLDNVNWEDLDLDWNRIGWSNL